MNQQTLRVIAGIVILAHGIGHCMPYFPALGINGDNENWNNHSWLLSRILGESVSKYIGLALWTAAMVGFILASLAVFNWLVPQAWFRDLAVWSSVLSLVTLFLYPTAFAAFFNKIGAVGVNLALLYALVWGSWPPLSDIQ